MDEKKSKGENQHDRTGLNARDWTIIGALSAIVIALVIFVVVRANRQEATAAAATDSAPATSAATAEAERAEAEGSVRRIKADELRAEMQRGEVLVIDVRDLDSYGAGHIAGAIHIPLADVESQVPYLPRGKAIVTYCT